MSLKDNLRARLIKTSTVKETATVKLSKIIGKKDVITTEVPMINAALSGSIYGGFTPGLTVLAGPSKHFKTGFSLLMIQAFLRKYPEGIVLFYDSEFGTPQEYFESFNIDVDSVVHTPVTDIEQLKFDIMTQLADLNRTDQIMIVIDSIGNIASKKEVQDALDGKSVADMTRAKQLKSLFRMVTPHLTLKDIPMIAINHTYQTQEMFSKAVVSGGCVAAGTEIQTPNGFKSVEDFNVGDRVITLSGDQLVTHVWNPDTLEDGLPDCYEIIFEDGYSVIVSDKHKFLIEGTWVEAKDLVIGLDCTVVYA